MEAWQKKHIEKNICSLIENTLCNTQFLAHLWQLGLITRIENDELSKLDKSIQADASTKLYGILQTRTNGYEGLTEALKATGQSGALHILRSWEEDPKIREMKIKSKAEKFFGLKVNFKGKTMSVKETFPSLAIADAENILNSEEVLKELDDLKTTIILTLDAKLPDLDSFYIPRFMSNRVELDPGVFKQEIPDIFVFKGISKQSLKNLVGTHFIQVSSEQLIYISSRHILLEDEEHWDDIVNIAEAPVHLISKEKKCLRDVYILIMSTKVSAVLACACNKAAKKNSGIYSSEANFIEKLRSNSENRGAVICDVPGMGKTYLLRSLAKGLQEKCPDDLVLYISLPSLAETISDQDEKSTFDTRFLRLALGSRLAASLIQHYLCQRKARLFIFLDGYDEININRLEKTKAFLKSTLSSIQSGSKIIIASRPHLRADLEKTFNVMAYDILPFDRFQQEQRLVKHWEQRYPKHNPEKLAKYAKHCVEGTQKLKGKSDPDILGVPLKCYLLAVVSEKQAQNYSNPNRETSINLPPESVAQSVFGLYQKFVETALEKVMSSRGDWSIQKRSEWKKNMRNFHTLKALDLLFPEVGAEYLRTMPAPEDIREHTINRIGIMSVTGSHYSFVHRSFAEFLAGQFLADLWLNAYQGSESKVLGSFSFPIENVLSTKLSVEGLLYGICLIANGFRQCNYLGYEFVNNNVLWFMDCSFATSLQFSRPETVPAKKRKQSQETESESWNTTEVVLYSKAEQNFIEDNLYSILISCVRGRLVQILRKIGELIRCSPVKLHLSTIFTSKSALAMFRGKTNQVPAETEQSSLCKLFLLLAECDSRELCHECFIFFGQSGPNCLRKLLRRHRPNFIERMINVLLHEKVPSQGMVSLLSGMRDFNCVDEKDLASPGLLAHSYILSVTSRVHKDSLCRSKKLDDILRRFDEMKTIFSFLKMDMRQLEYKTHIFNLLISIYTDDELFILLLILFGKERRTCEGIKLLIKPFILQRIEGGLTGEAVSGICWKWERVLDMIDVGDVRKAFDLYPESLGERLARSNLEGIEILKLLVAVSKKIKGMDYIHAAVFKGNVDWVRFLLEKGHVANQLDGKRKTPLLHIQKDCPLEITELLLLHGAKPYAVDELGNTAAHLFYRGYDSNLRLHFIEWTKCVLECGHYKLWTMKNKEGKTPLHILRTMLWIHKDGAIEKVIRSLIRPYVERAVSCLKHQKYD